MEVAGWENIPEPVLILILRRLKIHDVASCSVVCHRWAEITRDNLLWKWLLRRDFRTDTTTIRPGAACWRDEYERLVDRVPKVRVQSLTLHTDEVLHVAFSHDGNDLVSCSKDHKIIIWQREKNGVHFKKHFLQDMGIYNWVHTWAAQFNSSDTRLMVAGVVDQISGEIAIFNTGRDGSSSAGYMFMCRVVNDPYDVLGCWYNDHFFLSGTMTVEGLNLLDAQIFLCSPVLSENDNLINVQCYKRLLFKYRNLQGTIYVRYVQKHNRQQFEGQLNNTEWPSNQNVIHNLKLPENEDLSEHEKSQFLGEQVCIIFMCGDRTKIPHQLGFQRISMDCLKSPPCLRGPEKVIDFNGHVIGMAISPDGQYLYVNVRTWPDNAVPTTEQAPPISSQIELQIVDLLTLTRIGKPLFGHRGFTPSEKAFYLYVDVSKTYVGSGSEDGRGCLWDRHYGALAARLCHSECVNCVVICPSDEEVCVTASDDRTLSVWTSHRRIRNDPELTELKQDEL